MTLQSRLGGAKMILKGAGGIFLNEIVGAIYGEPQSTYEINQLPKGYMIKGLGHMINKRNLINNGRTYIKSYRQFVETKQKIFQIENGKNKGM